MLAQKNESKKKEHLKIACICILILIFEKLFYMKNPIDPIEFGITGKTIIEQVGKNHYAIVISRKSRIIMADGRKLWEKLI